MAHMRVGVHPLLEAEADRLLRKSLAGVTKHSEKADILTPWKQRRQRHVEVHASSGTPDPSIRRGMFGRSANPARPELNSRDGVARPQSGLQRFMDEQDRKRSTDNGNF